MLLILILTFIKIKLKRIFTIHFIFKKKTRDNCRFLYQFNIENNILSQLLIFQDVRIIALYLNFLIPSIRSTHCDIGKKNLSPAPENRDFLVGCHREEKTKPSTAGKIEFAQREIDSGMGLDEFLRIGCSDYKRRTHR